MKMLICPRCSCIFKILEGKDLQQQAAMKVGCTAILNLLNKHLYLNTK